MLKELTERLRAVQFLQFRRLPDERKLYPHLFNDQSTPDITVGSIVFAGLVKTAIVVPIIWFVVETYHLQYYWMVALFVLFAVVAYPAYRKYDQFKEQSRRMSDDLICTKCKHFDSTGILCTIYDEHVSKQKIPCGGDSWEARGFGD